MFIKKLYYDFIIFINKIFYKLTIKISEKFFSKIRNRSLKDKKFTIISNNCWAGYIYRRYGLCYLTPTIGLFIMPKDYIKFCENLKYYLDSELEFIKPSQSKYSYEISSIDDRFGKYPIGVIDDIEIHFLHYKDKNEAKTKWNRRKKRVNYDNLLFKFNDQNGCTEEDLKKFNDLELQGKKICFTSKSASDKRNIFVKEYSCYNYVKDDMLFSKKYFKINDYFQN